MNDGRAFDTKDLYAPGKVSRADERAFVIRLVVTVLLAAAGMALALQGRTLAAACGVTVLAFIYCHAVELQHQCLHRTAFRRPWMHRLVGVPLGLPLLVAYSHYRARHLQHHRYLGTDKDAEFFGFDSQEPVTWRRFIKGLLDYKRLATVLDNVQTSVRGTWRYDQGQISERFRQAIMTDYRILGAFLLVMLVLCPLGAGRQVVLLWALPMILAVPIHFLIELPEHAFCDSSTEDVLRNTRSITGSWFSTWLTNGNNLHIEHHLAMTVPMTRLRARHRAVQRHAEVVDRSYATFYWNLFLMMSSSSKELQCAEA